MGFVGGETDLEGAFKSIGNVHQPRMGALSIGLDLNQCKLKPLEKHIMGK